MSGKLLAHSRIVHRKAMLQLEKMEPQRQYWVMLERQWPESGTSESPWLLVLQRGER